MDSSITQKFKGIALTEEEEEIIEFDDAEDEVINEQLALCLIGKLLSPISQPIDAMKTAFKSAWRVSKDVFFREVDKNLYIIQFMSPIDRRYALDNGPWTFKGFPLLLKEMNGGEQPSTIVFDHIRLWVKIEDIPFNKRSKSLAVKIALKLGSFVEYDQSDPLFLSTYMRVRVDKRLDKPLLRQIKLGPEQYVKLTYEKLPNFCFMCGMFGHEVKDCESFDEELPESEYPYGVGLRASPVKVRKSADPRKEMELRMCKEFRDSLMASKARQKLNFDQEGGENSVQINSAMTIFENPIAKPTQLIEEAQSNPQVKRGRVQGEQKIRRGKDGKIDLDEPMYDEEAAVSVIGNQVVLFGSDNNGKVKAISAEFDKSQLRREQ